MVTRIKKDAETLIHLSIGQRTHYLANLGGLVVIAGLTDIAPDLLLGALMEIAARLPKLTAARVLELKRLGGEKLSERQADKKSFNSWRRANTSERFDFTQDEMKTLIKKLGGKLPAFEKDISSELRRKLHEVFHASTP